MTQTPQSRSVIYDISHRTTFSYATSVATSQHLLHLAPRAVGDQTVHNQAIIVEPAPTLRKEGQDYFGNPTTYLTVEEPHTRLNIVSTARIERYAPVVPPAEATLAWEGALEAVRDQFQADALQAMQFTFDSPLTGSKLAMDFAAPSFQPGRPILAVAMDLMARIHADFKYEEGVTDIQTPVDRVLTDRRGVCQDFAHLQIACLRAFGLPARYVSGYLCTRPPEGQNRLIGADASHAWLSIWVPEAGWIDLDPTNNTLPATEHISVAWGRDYADVSPINGFVVGGGRQLVDVAVDVRPQPAIA